MFLSKLALMVLIAILPVTRPKHPRASVLSRGPEVLGIDKNESFPQALADARAKARGLRRVVVLPFVVETEAGRLNGAALQRELIQDLQFVPALIAIDEQTIANIGIKRPGQPGEVAADQVAAALSGDIVVFGSVRHTPDGVQATVRTHARGEKKAGSSFVVQQKQFNLFRLSNEIMQRLLKDWRTEVSNVQQAAMFAIPTESEEARVACDQAHALLAKWNQATNSDDRSLLQQAQASAKAATKADPNYLPAYIVAASAAEADGSEPDRDEFLKAGRQRVRPMAMFNRRTVLELEADHELYVMQNPLAARQKYVEILQLCPNDALALWRALDLIAGPTPKGVIVSAADKKQVASYAARLKAMHPHSPLTRMLGIRN